MRAPGTASACLRVLPTAHITGEPVYPSQFVDKTPAAVDVSGAENLVQAVETMREAQKGL